MADALVREFGTIVVRTPSEQPWARTPWGEEASVLVSPLHHGQSACIMDYRAPANFGPPRHTHFRDDEILRLVAGEIVVWSPTHCCHARTGDIVVLPRGVPHTWRSLAEPVRMEVTTTPGDLEVFFQRLMDEKVTIEQVDRLDAITAAIGVENVGPRLSEDEAQTILAGRIP